MTIDQKHSTEHLTLALLLIAPSWILKAAVVRSFWLWFLVPLGVPAISYAQALGLGFLATLLTPGIRGFPKETIFTGETPLSTQGISILAYLIAWGTGWIFWQGMGMGL